MPVYRVPRGLVKAIGVVLKPPLADIDSMVSINRELGSMLFQFKYSMHIYTHTYMSQSFFFILSPIYCMLTHCIHHWVTLELGWPQWQGLLVDKSWLMMLWLILVLWALHIHTHSLTQIYSHLYTHHIHTSGSFLKLKIYDQQRSMLWAVWFSGLYCRSKTQLEKGSAPCELNNFLLRKDSLAWIP